MLVSVIILAWNGLNYLKPCLNTVLAQDSPEFEVIVVDNGSTDGSADFVAAQYPQVRLIRNAYNLGFAAGNNVGLRAAAGDVLVLLNQDTEVQPGWLMALVDAVKDPTVGIAGCKLLYPDGTIQHAGGRIIARGLSWHIGYGETDTGQYNVIKDMDFVTGAALALTRATLTRIGLLDEEFVPVYYEDVDWCYRARAAGLRVIYYPEAVAMHYEAASSKVGSYVHKTSFHAGRLRFLFKHKSLDDLQTLFVPAESEDVCTLGPGGELEALRQAWVGILLALPNIVQFRLHYIEPDVDPHLMHESLLQIALTLRDLCAKDSPFSAPQASLDEDEAGTSLLALLHRQWQIAPQPMRSDVPVLGKGIAAFREAWLSVAARWYVEALMAQQRTFNANVVQLNTNVVQQLEQITDNIARGQQENAQHVRELNVLLSEVLRLRMRVTELEAKLEQHTEIE